MIGKGKIRGGGAALARYMLTAKEGEVVQFIGQRGFDFFDKDMVRAFDITQIVAEAQTNSTKPFFHAQFCPVPGERLTDAQVAEMVDRSEKRLGFTGQPRLVTAHIDLTTGDTHYHVAWFRMDMERECSIDPGMFKLKLKELSREYEKDFGLKIVSNERQPGDRARYADRDELEESRRLGTNDRTIRGAILDCVQKADSGKAFDAAIRAQGGMVAWGDRRNVFVVVDHEGGQHALNKKLTGMTLAQTAQRFADLDHTQLPSVEQAQAMQRDRKAERQQIKEAAPGRVKAGEPERKIGQTATAIREAAAGQDFARGLKERGFIFAYVTPEEVKTSQREKALAKAEGRQSRVLKEGFGVVDTRGNVYRIDERTTGVHWRGVQAQLAATDRSQLPSVADARAQMKELNRAAREQNGSERKTVHSLEAQEAAIMSQLAQLHRAFHAEATRTTEPAAPNFDRDKADAEWMNRLEKAAIQNEIEKDKAARKPRERGAEKQPDAPAASGPYADLRAAQPAPEPTPEKPLGKTAGDMRMAWTTSRSAEQLEEALAARIIGLAVVSPDEAKGIEMPVSKQRQDGKNYEPWMMQAGGVSGLSNEYRESAERSYEKWTEINPEAAAKHDFADYVQYVQRKWAEDERRPEDRPANRRPAFKEGEIVAVDGRGHVYRFDERTTGDKNPDIMARFPGIDRAALMSVTDTQEAMKEASLAAWKSARQAEREAARPASWIENRIAECGGQSALYATVTRDRDGRGMSQSEILADKLDGWRAGIEAAKTGAPNTYKPKGQSATVYGVEAIAARLEEAGIALVRVSIADEIALRGLRRDEELKSTAAATNRESMSGNRFADVLPGEFAAVTRGGDVYRINIAKLGDAAQCLAAPLPSVIAARDAFKTDREKTEKLWEQWRAERTTDREAKASEREDRATDAQDRREERQTARDIGAAVDKGFGIARKIAEKAIKLWETAVDVLFGWAMAPAPLTRQQVHEKRQAQGNVETLHAEAVAEMRQTHDKARADQIDETDRERDIREAELYSRFGHVLNQPAQPREIDRDGGREREREREHF